MSNRHLKHKLYQTDFFHKLSPLSFFLISVNSKYYFSYWSQKSWCYLDTFIFLISYTLICQRIILVLLSNQYRIWPLFTTFTVCILFQATILFPGDYCNRCLLAPSPPPSIYTIFNKAARLISLKSKQTKFTPLSKRLSWLFYWVSHCPHSGFLQDPSRFLPCHHQHHLSSCPFSNILP